MKVTSILILFIISLILSNCANRQDSQTESRTEHPVISKNDIQDSLLIKKVNIDTNGIIADIRSKYYFMIRHKNGSKIETSRSYENHEDSEPDGDYSENTLNDTLFIINDTLSYKKTVNEGENHINTYYERDEIFYNQGVVLFTFSQSFKYMNFHNESIIEERRSYFYKGKIIRCIERNLTFNYAIDVSYAIDSLSNIKSYKCIDKER